MTSHSSKSSAVLITNIWVFGGYKKTSMRFWAIEVFRFKT